MSVFIEFRQALQKHGLEWFGKYYGTYRGFVEDNDDPDGLGRLRIRVPSIYGQDSLTKFALPKGVYSGTGVGAYAIPLNNDPIWVTFENGDPRFPIWEYGWRPDKLDGAEPGLKIFQTESGHRIEIDDNNGHIRIREAGGDVFEINENGISLGSEGVSAEPAVLGDKNADLHDASLAQAVGIVDALTQFAATQSIVIAAATPLAPLAAGYTALTAALGILKTTLETIKNTQVEATKSSKVTLD